MKLKIPACCFHNKRMLLYGFVVFCYTSLLVASNAVYAETMDLYLATGDMPKSNERFSGIPKNKLPACKFPRKKLHTLEVEFIGRGQFKYAYLIEKTGGKVDGKKVLSVARNTLPFTTNTVIENLHSAMFAKSRGIPVVEHENKLYCAPCPLDETGVDADPEAKQSDQALCMALITAYKAPDEYIELHFPEEYVDAQSEGPVLAYTGSRGWSELDLENYSTAVLVQFKNDILLILEKYFESSIYRFPDLQGFLNKKTGELFLHDIPRVAYLDERIDQSFVKELIEETREENDGIPRYPSNLQGLVDKITDELLIRRRSKL